MKCLEEIYKTEITPNIKQQFKLSNSFLVPKITQLSINVGLGKIKENPKFLDIVAQDIFYITGQKPQLRLAKKAISGFKIRKGDIVGLRVTLRRKKMYDFLEKLIKIVLPRTRDFRGISQTSFDKQSNYTLAIREHIVFPEIEYDNVDTIYGLQVSIITNSSEKKMVFKLLKLLGLPFKDE